MIKIKLFSIKKSKIIEGEVAELYCNLYLVLNRTYIFTFLIESPDIAFSDRHLIRLIKTWIISVEFDSVKWLRRFESKMRGKREWLEKQKEDKNE